MRCEQRRRRPAHSSSRCPPLWEPLSGSKTIPRVGPRLYIFSVRPPASPSVGYTSAFSSKLLRVFFSLPGDNAVMISAVKRVYLYILYICYFRRRARHTTTTGCNSVLNNYHPLAATPALKHTMFPPLPSELIHYLFEIISRSTGKTAVDSEPTTEQGQIA